MATVNDSLAAMVADMPLAADIEQELRRGFNLELSLARARQRKIAEANRRRPRRTVDGLGQVTMSIDPFLRALLERRFGRHCFRDRRFVSGLLADNPEFRPPTDRRATITIPCGPSRPKR